MHKNTYLLAVGLAIFAALVVAVNVGRRLTGTTFAPAPSPTVPVSPTPKPTTYTNTLCGFTFEYPSSLSVMANASGSAIFTDTSDIKRSVVVICQKDAPRPPLAADKIESVQIPNPGGATISAKLYHDSSAKDGTPIDEIIFRNPKNGYDVYIAGIGELYDAVTRTIRMLP